MAMEWLLSCIVQALISFLALSNCVEEEGLILHLSFWLYGMDQNCTVDTLSVSDSIPCRFILNQITNTLSDWKMDPFYFSHHPFKSLNPFDYTLVPSPNNLLQQQSTTSAEFILCSISHSDSGHE